MYCKYDDDEWLMSLLETYGTAEMLCDEIMSQCVDENSQFISYDRCISYHSQRETRSSGCPILRGPTLSCASMHMVLAQKRPEIHCYQYQLFIKSFLSNFIGERRTRFTRSFWAASVRRRCNFNILHRLSVDSLQITQCFSRHVFFQTQQPHFI